MIAIGSESDITEIITFNEIVVVVFTAKWCVSCATIVRILENIKLKNDKFIFANFDIDKQIELALTQKIHSIPLLYYYKKGSLYLKESGLKSQEHIEKNISSLINLNEFSLMK